MVLLDLVFGLIFFLNGNPVLFKFWFSKIISEIK